MKDYSEKKTSRKTSVGNIIGYLLSIIISFIFALYCIWRVGFFLVLTFMLAPFLSLLLTLCFVHRIVVKTETSKSFVGKKESFLLSVTMHNHFCLPTPSIIIETYDHPKVIYESLRYELSLMPFSQLSLKIPVTASICGAGSVGISKVYISDYLNIFTFHLKEKYLLRDDASLLHPLSIVPDIVDVSSKEEYIRQTYTLCATTGESDETVETTTNVMGGFPGYEHREYVPGDPLKRINWKLSAKRDKLFVRLDDEIESSRVYLILDPVSHITEADLSRLPQKLYAHSSSHQLPALIAQNAIETSLGIARTLLNRNVNVTYYYLQEGKFLMMNISDMRQITLLQQNLASYQFTEHCNRRFPLSEIPTSGAMFICTPCRYTEIPFPGAMVYSSLDGKGRKL